MEHENLSPMDKHLIPDLLVGSDIPGKIRTMDMINSTFDSEENSTLTWNEFFGIINACLIPVIVIGNSMILVTICRFRKFRTAVTSLIGSLAMADLLLGAVTLPLYVAFYYHGDVLKEIKYLCLVKYTFALGTMSASLLSLVAIAFVHFIAITRPIYYRSRLTIRQAIIIMTSVWTYNVVISVLPLLGWNYYDENAAINGTHLCNFFATLPKPYTIITTPVMIFLALVLSAYFYIRIYQKTIRHNKRLFGRRSVNSDRSVGIRQFQKDTRSAKVMAVVSILFYIFWLPFIIGCVMKYISPTGKKSEVIKNVVLTLAMSNSAVNPLIYCWLRRDFRMAFIMIICCKPGKYLHRSTTSKQNLIHNQKNPYIINRARKTLSDSSSTDGLETTSVDSPTSVFSDHQSFLFNKGNNSSSYIVNEIDTRF